MLIGAGIESCKTCIRRLLLPMSKGDMYCIYYVGFFSANLVFSLWTFLHEPWVVPIAVTDNRHGFGSV